MNLETWLAFVAASMILTMTPGPSILLGVVHAVHYGPARTVFTALGDISANFIQMLLVALGLGVVIAESTLAFMLIKWAGVGFLLYIALKMLFSAPVEMTVNQPRQQASAWRLYGSGFAVAAGNPKALVFFTAFFPQFIDPGAELLPQMMILCPTMALLDFTWVMIYACGAHRFLSFMQQRPRLLNQCGGSALLAACVMLAAATQ